jgi:hypothetical protein
VAVTAVLAFDALAILAIIGWCVSDMRRVMRQSSRNARLVAKLERPRPPSARDWPELRVETVVPDPDVPNTLLVVVQWPAHPSPRSLLVLSAAGSDERARRLLVSWRDSEASVSPTRVGDRGVVFRRRRDPQQLRAVLVHESSVA